MQPLSSRNHRTLVGRPYHEANADTLQHICIRKIPNDEPVLNVGGRGCVPRLESWELECTLDTPWRKLSGQSPQEGPPGVEKLAHHHHIRRRGNTTVTLLRTRRDPQRSSLPSQPMPVLRCVVGYGVGVVTGVAVGVGVGRGAGTTKTSPAQGLTPVFVMALTWTSILSPIWNPPGGFQPTPPVP